MVLSSSPPGARYRDRRAATRCPGRRWSSQSRSIHIVVRNASPLHGIASGANEAISSASRVGAAVPPTTRDSKAIVTTAASSRVYSPMISPGSTMQARLLERLADRRLVDGLVDLEEPTGLRPRTATGLDAPAEQDDLAVSRDRQRGDHQSRIDVGDVAA